MRYRASVSFEHDLRPVQTWRGELTSTRAHTAALRALREASSAHPQERFWRSVVVVLEKLEDLPPEAD
jgi:hypothetical protein